MRISIKKMIFMILLVVILPIITGTISYMLDRDKNNIYVSKTTIELAKMENQTYSDPVYVTNRILSSNFLKEALEESKVKISVEDLKSSTSVQSKPAGYIDLIVESTDKDQGQILLASITEQFLKESTKQYDELDNLMSDTINRISQNENHSENAFEMERLLYDLKLKILNMQEAKVTETPKTELQSISPINKAVTSAFLTFSILILLLIGYGLLKRSKK